ncbi:hypothetical protein J7T55_010873 [Diaporthe amygdali]|uniref:uncharacterized protein n=1 Tax=Phomopsis amygdali TaxID=1214568 RepID=UPI0022FEA158|nr:uncharacterized protein J7T55_010873 [Diaporthe amygdali]KAJ0104409.1 hypothetical protein J7T55_010873 [Diaporthe amygdali]
MAKITDLSAELLAKIFTENGLPSRDLASAAVAASGFTFEATRAAFIYNINHERSSVLVWAARHGQIKQIRRALTMGASPNTLGPGHGESKEKLDEYYHYESEDEYDGPDAYGAPLHYAALQGFDEMVLLLLQHGARMDVPSFDVCPCVENCHLGLDELVPTPRWYPLHHAVCNGHVSTANILLDYGAPLEMSYLDQTWFSSRTLLHCAAARGLDTLVQRALELGADVSELSPYGDSVLHFTSESWKSASVIKILLGAGARLEANESEHGRTPIFQACHLANYSTAMHLLKAGAKTNLARSSRSTPSLLHLAVDIGYSTQWDIRPQAHGDRDKEQVNFIRALIDGSGFDVNEFMIQHLQHGVRRVTPLCCALDLDEPRVRTIEQLNLDVAILLLQKGADPNRTSRDRSRDNPVPLEYALRHFLSEAHAEPKSRLIPKLRRLINLMLDCGAQFSTVEEDLRFDVEAEAELWNEGHETSCMLKRLLNQHRKQASPKVSPKKNSPKKK